VFFTVCFWVLIICNYLKLATAAPETHVLKKPPYVCNVYFLVPNIRYRPNISQHFLAEYSFSAETDKSVFGRSLVSTFFFQAPLSPPMGNFFSGGNSNSSLSPSGGGSSSSSSSVFQFICTQCANVFATHSELAKHQDAYHGASPSTERYVAMMIRTFVSLWHV
jgi:hypothetical protein